MKKSTKRWLSLALTLVMLLGMVPAFHWSARAAEELSETLQTNTGENQYSGGCVSISCQDAGDDDGFMLRSTHTATISLTDSRYVIQKIEVTRGWYDTTNIKSKVGTVSYSGNVATITNLGEQNVTLYGSSVVQVKSVTVYYTHVVYVAAVTAGSGSASTHSGFSATAGTSGNWNEDYGNLVDGNKDSKWCITNLQSTNYIEFKSDSPITPTSYILTTGNDTAENPGRNPKSWTLKGKLNADDEWITLATVNDDNVLKAVNYQSYSFTIDTIWTSCQYFRFEFTAIQSGSVFQLSELELVSGGTYEYTTIEKAVAKWFDGTLKPYEDFTYNSAITITSDKTLDLNGHTLTLSKTVSVTSGTLTVMDSVGGGQLKMNGNYNLIKVGADAACVVEGGTLTGSTKDKSVICGNGAITLNGGTVQSSGSNAFSLYANATLNLAGGTVSCTSASTTMSTSSAVLTNNDSNITVNVSGSTISANAGCAVYTRGVGSTVNITGGALDSASAYAVSGSAQGAITISGDPTLGGKGVNIGRGVSCVINGGTIAGLTVGEEATCEINGGTVTGGEDNAAIVSSGAVTLNGGAVQSDTGNAFSLSENATLNLVGGTVTTTSDSEDMTVSSAVLTDDGANITVNVSGSTVTANAGCAIYTGGTGTTVNITGGSLSSTSAYALSGSAQGAISIGGKPTVGGLGIYLFSGNKLNVTASMTNSAAIAVTMEDGTGVFTSDFNGKGRISKFKSGVSGLGIMLTESGDAKLVTPGAEDYVIYKVDGWNDFCDAVKNTAVWNGFSGMTVKLGADVGTVTTMAGTSAYPFMGTFDGDGHKLTIKYNNNNDDTRTAPFSYVNGATFQNLKIAGTISGSKRRAGGLLGTAQNTNGRTYVTNCVCSVNITGDRFIGGFMIEGSVTFTGCVYNGKIVTSGNGKDGGFSGYSGAIINDCIFAPQSGSKVGYTFSYLGPTLTNAYYTSAIGRIAVQGTAPRTVTGGEDVTVNAVNPVGEATATYSLSGITAYENGLYYNGKFYYGNGDKVELTLSYGERIGYDVIGYIPSAGTLEGDIITMPDSNVTIEGEWVEAPPITWKNDDGTVIDTKYVAPGKTPTHADPVKDADAQYTYTFAGWDPEIAAVTGEATYTAQFDSTVNQYTVTFVDEDGETVLANAQEIEYGSTATEPDPAPTKDGYEFDRWLTEVGDDFDFDTPITKDITLVASWSEAGDVDIDWSEAEIEFNDNSKGLYAYTGSAITPNYTLTIDGSQLTEDFDYEIVEGSETSAKALGLHTITLADVNNAENTFKIQWYVYKLTVTSAEVSGSDTKIKFTAKRNADKANVSEFGMVFDRKGQYGEDVDYNSKTNVSKTTTKTTYTYNVTVVDAGSGVYAKPYMKLTVNGETHTVYGEAIFVQRVQPKQLSDYVVTHTAAQDGESVAITVTRSNFDVDGYELVEFGVLYSRAGKTTSIDDADETLLVQNVGNGTKKAFKAAVTEDVDNYVKYVNTIAYSTNHNTMYTRGYAILKNTSTNELAYVHSDVVETGYNA